MKLQQLTLQSFRCFAQETITFDERLTVFVGKNGSGKTAVLDAVAIAFNGILRHMHTRYNEENIYSIRQDDVNFYEKKPTSFAIKFYLNKEKIDILIPKDVYTYNGFSHTYTEHLKKFITKIHMQEEKILFSYYNCTRLSGIRKEKSYFPDDEGYVAACWNCLEPSLSFSDTMQWIDTHDADEARRFREGEQDYRDPELSAMREAVEKALPGFSGLQFRGATKEILVTRKSDGQKLSFRQLSDGYRAMLVLILDLARRMALANGKRYAERRSVLESPAIVLIDEVELHLHPGWQQTVLPSLLEIFPNTQFIVTTHSPQVLSSIEPHTIRLLEGGRCIPYEGSTYGAESSRILEEVFGISLRAKTDAKTALDAYLKLVQNGDYGSPQALELRQKLDAWLSGDPILDSADMLIRRAERQKAREADRAQA